MGDDEWIDVRRSLPEPGQVVLAFAPLSSHAQYCYAIAHMGDYDKVARQSHWYTNEGKTSIWPVEAWQPLPSMPPPPR